MNIALFGATGNVGPRLISELFRHRATGPRCYPSRARTTLPILRLGQTSNQMIFESLPLRHRLVTTVFFTALGTTGATKQKSFLRILGAAIGGPVLGIGCTACLFPLMDSITSLVVLVATIAFIAAWCATGRRCEERQQDRDA